MRWDMWGLGMENSFAGPGSSWGEWACKCRVQAVKSYGVEHKLSGQAHADFQGWLQGRVSVSHIFLSASFVFCIQWGKNKIKSRLLKLQNG